MKSSPSPKPPVKLGLILRRRLRELRRSPAELAEALEVPATYVDELIAGCRRPPLPGRTDLYERMTSFLRLGRNDLVTCARAERAGSPASVGSGPGVEIRRQLLALCEPGKARTLERRRARRGGAELVGIVQRLLDVAQVAVRRVLDDQIGLRLAAAERGRSYAATRLRVLEFLDATPDTLTLADLTEFLRPRIARWDVDLETGVLRVVLRAPEYRDRSRRPGPGARAGAAELDAAREM